MGGGASVGRMWIVAFTFSLVVAALGALGVVAPGSLGAVVATLLTLTGLYVAAALRIVLGAALFVAAPASRFPRTFRVIGIPIVVAGLATPLVGVERARAIVEWETARGLMFMRIPATFALALGLFLVYAMAPGRQKRTTRKGDQSTPVPRA